MCYSVWDDLTPKVRSSLAAVFFQFFFLQNNLFSKTKPGIDFLFNIMLDFFCKTLIHTSSIVKASPTKCLCILQYPSLRSISTTSNITNQQAFTVSYLINSCGLSPENALSASKRVNFGTPEKSDSVLALFNDHGFSKAHISNLVRKYPRVLLSKADKTLLPKLNFFYSIGFSSLELANLLSSNPNFLRRDLENLLIPSFNVLRDIKVPEENILLLLKDQSRLFGIPFVKFKELVDVVKEMGFDPLKMNFVLALDVLSGISKSTWERKVEIYKRWGWSEEHTFQAFGKYPGCMKYSEEKIMAAMDFFVNKMGWESSFFVRRPQFIALSLDKRIVPRCTVAQVLISKGLIKKDIGPNKLLLCSEYMFLQQFVTRYKNEAPELMKLYQEAMVPSE